jgi:hypothetical protein
LVGIMLWVYLRPNAQLGGFTEALTGLESVVESKPL